MKRLAVAIALLAALIAASPGSAAAPTIANFFMRGAAYPGGQSPVAQINLTAAAASDVTIAIASDHPDVATVPASITIPAGKKNVQFSVKTVVVSAPVTVTLTATPAGGASARMSFSVMPPQLLALTVPSKLTGGTSGAGSVRLSAAAPAGGVVVSLASGSDLLSVPESVTVAAGQTQAKFTVSTVGPETRTTVTVTASDAYGSVSRNVSVVPVTLSSVAVSPGSVKGGRDTRGTVKLTGPATVDTVVSLSSASALVTVQESVTVPAGSTSATFGVGTSDVDATTRVTITATLGSVSKTAKVGLTA